MPSFKTDQESFWAGDFGDEYAARNRGANLVAANIALFSRVLSATRQVRSVIEFGANVGLNLQAIRQLLPEARLTAVEINSKAVDELKALGGIEIVHQSILDFAPTSLHDLVLIKGVLIHINPDALPGVYRTLHSSSARYICLAEYYNPSPAAISYRGHADRLFKRDFAGEMLQAFPSLKLVDYGFVYHGDPSFPQDDITWFLLEK